MPATDVVAVVCAWQEAVNRQDADGLLALSTPGIEVVGPRGSGYGHALLREWLARAGLRLTTERIFARGEVVVVAQRGVWAGQVPGAAPVERHLASRFRVTGGRVAQFARYDDLATALAAAGLDDADEVPVGPAFDPLV
jgi:SnoaL-like domain